MTGQNIVVESSAVNERKELSRTATAMTTKDDEKRSGGGNQHKRIGEVAGGTAAECAMVCCCCPCTVLHFLLLALYKVPTGLCRKAWRNKKRKKVLKKKNINNSPAVFYTDDDKDYFDGGGNVNGGSRETAEFETEMWHRFYDGAGFGRSSSQKELQEEEQQQHIHDSPDEYYIHVDKDCSDVTGDGDNHDGGLSETAEFETEICIWWSSNGTTTTTSIIPTTAMIMTEVHRKRPVMEIATNSRTDEKKKSQYRQLKIK